MTTRVGPGESLPGGVVCGVAPGSSAEEAGIRAGDRLVSVDGLPLRDVLDWQWLTAEDEFDVGVVSAGARERMVRVVDAAAPTGVEFADRLFDGVRTCENACGFCFVSQLPPGLRDALYVRDDDFRLSFLDGNFVTLTNVDDDDVARIVEQRLSPLHVSVHATDPEVRRALMCAGVPDEALRRVDELLTGGIELHVQVVLVPGVNDGEVLEGTLAWLADREGVTSVGVVPVGHTRHQSRITRSFEEPEAAAAVIEALTPWQGRMAAERGTRWVYAADELYLAAGRDVPPADEYDGYPQYENGIGMVRDFLDEWDASCRSASALGEARRLVVVTGEMFAPVLERVWPVPGGVMGVRNAFFGGNVAVTGLLTGKDVASAVAARGGDATYLVPDVVVNRDGLTLDGMDAAGIVRAAGGADVRLISCGAAALSAAAHEGYLPAPIEREA